MNENEKIIILKKIKSNKINSELNYLLDIGLNNPDNDNFSILNAWQDFTIKITEGFYKNDTGIINQWKNTAIELKEYRKISEIELQNIFMSDDKKSYDFIHKGLKYVWVLGEIKKDNKFEN